MKTVTDKALKAAKCPPHKRFQKVAISQGLLLQINADGSKWWRFRYSFQATEKMLSLGVYPDVRLKAAGERRDELRALLREGIDPGAERKREKVATVALTANGVESVAREWHQLQTVKWSASHAERIMRRFEREVFPWLGSRDIATIEPPTCCKSSALSKSAASTKPRTAFLKV